MHKNYSSVWRYIEFVWLACSLDGADLNFTSFRIIYVTHYYVIKLTLKAVFQVFLSVHLYEYSPQ